MPKTPPETLDKQRLYYNQVKARRVAEDALARQLFLDLMKHKHAGLIEAASRDSKLRLLVAAVLQTRASVKNAQTARAATRRRAEAVYRERVAQVAAELTTAA